MSFVYHCDCPGWAKAIGITFDTEDLRNCAYTVCPCCRKSFEVEPELPKEPELRYEDSGKSNVMLYVGGLCILIFFILWYFRL